MISDWELWACARQQIEHYGDEAAVAAAMRADALLADGDLDGHLSCVDVVELYYQNDGMHGGGGTNVLLADEQAREDVNRMRL